MLYNEGERVDIESAFKILDRIRRYSAIRVHWLGVVVVVVVVVLLYADPR